MRPQFRNQYLDVAQKAAKAYPGMYHYLILQAADMKSGCVTQSHDSAALYDFTIF